MKYTYTVALMLSVILSLSACNEDGDLAPVSGSIATPDVAKNVATTTGQPEVVVYKNASCGCCTVWIDHMQSHGFPVTSNDVDNMGPIKERVGVPPGMGSCHTAEVGGYFIEGHVPAADVQRLLTEKPDARGLTVPGMPVGSPGMEQGGRVDPYQVFLVHDDGSTSVYATYPEEAASH